MRSKVFRVGLGSGSNIVIVMTIVTTPKSVEMTATRKPSSNVRWNCPIPPIPRRNRAIPTVKIGAQRPILAEDVIFFVMFEEQNQTVNAMKIRVPSKKAVIVSPSFEIY